jgi:molybdopterin-containing oxidoreductase family iron-sulfur binding subunit
MKVTRKEFLLLGSAALLGVGAGKAVGALGGPAAPENPGPKPVRWGMVIDTRACAEQGDCQKCRSACHQAHNVPEIPEPRQEVKWIWKEARAKVFPLERHPYAPQAKAAPPLPVMCNHCAQPRCVQVCPTRATWKRQDGIVMMDYHRCIGCRYCMAACPYGARSFNFVDPRPHVAGGNPEYPTRTKGVVEKCDFCQERLAEGRQPACVEGCPGKALVFGDLNDEQSAVRQLLRERLAVQRRPELGTGPAVFYLI